MNIKCFKTKLFSQYEFSFFKQYIFKFKVESLKSKLKFNIALD